jgi:NitT/TauT family transport system substrate-binding protein
MRRVRTSSCALLTSLLATTLAVSCGNAGTGGAGGLEKQTLTVASLPLVDVAGIHIAIRQKLFEAEGLRVRIKPVAQSIQALPALKNGQVDVIGGGNYVTFLQAYQRGTIDVRIMSDASSQAPRFMALLTMPNSPIKTAEDLPGKTVAVNILNNIQSLTFNQVLRANNVDPSKIRYRAVPFPQMGAALQKGQVDAVHTGEPFGTAFQRRLKARVIVDGGGPPVTGLPVSGYLTTQDFLRKYPKTAAAFQRAIKKGQRLAASDRKNVEVVLPSYARVDRQTAAALSLPGYPVTPDPAALQRLVDLMQHDGLLERTIDTKRLIFTPPAK